MLAPPSVVRVPRGATLAEDSIEATGAVPGPRPATAKAPAGTDPVAPARAGRENAVVAHLMGPWRGDQGHESVDEFTALHQDVAGAVAPTVLQAQGEPAVGMFFEAFVCERWPRDVAAQAFEAAAIARGHRHRGVQAQAAVLRNAARSLGVVVAGCRFDAVAESPPALARVGSAGAARSQRSRCEHGEQRLIPGEGVFVFGRAFRHDPLQAARRAREHPRHCVMIGRG